MAVSQSRPRSARRSPGPPANVTCCPGRASALTPLPVPVAVTELAGALLADGKKVASLASCGTAPRVVDAGSRPASVLSSLLSCACSASSASSCALYLARAFLGSFLTCALVSLGAPPIASRRQWFRTFKQHVP